MEGHSSLKKYSDCDHIARKYVKGEISEDVARELALEDNPICPLYEKRIHDYQRMKNNSLQRNEFLKCRWKSFVRHCENRTYEPFVFPNLRDFHFVNYCLRYRPDETITNRSTYRKQMGEGPGVDIYGQIPIPRDTTLRKTKLRENKIGKLPTKKNVN